MMKRIPTSLSCPQKVDQFVEYINKTYFAGQLDVNNAEVLKKGMVGFDDETDDDEPRRVFNADDSSGTSPALPRRIYMS